MKLVLLCLFLTCLGGYIGAVKFRCDYSYGTQGWFKYHRIPATWIDARLRCRHEGALLASPTSTEIKATMIDAIKEVDIFTGIHAISPGTYRSVEGRPLESITHVWADNEPDNKNDSERCISMNSEGKFSDVSCEVPRPFVCYRANSLIGANDCGTTDRDYHYISKLNKCYKFHAAARTFEQADFVCSAEGGHLAIINSDYESRAIYNIFPKDKSQIVGANRTDVALIGFLNVDGDWTTIFGQSLKEAGFNMFFPGEPNNNTGEYCGSVYRNGFLNDVWCDKPFAFICEKKINYPPVCESDSFLDRNTVKPQYLYNEQ